MCSQGVGTLKKCLLVVPREGNEEAQGAGCLGEGEPWEALPLSRMWTLCVLRDGKAGGQKTQGQTLMGASTLNTNICCCAEGTLSLPGSF